MVRVIGSKLPSNMMVVSTLASVAARSVVGCADVGAGGGLMAEELHSCHENGRIGSLIFGAGGRTVV